MCGPGMKTPPTPAPSDPSTEEGSIITDFAIHDPFKAALALQPPASRDGNRGRRALHGRLRYQPIVLLLHRLLYEIILRVESLLVFEYATAMFLYDNALLDVASALLVGSTGLSVSRCICNYRAYLYQTLC